MTCSFQLASAVEPSVRRGLLTLGSSKVQKTLQTPAIFSYTLRGQVPHLTPDMLDDQTAPAVQVALQHFIVEGHILSGGPSSGMHRFLGYPNEKIILCDLLDPSGIRPTPPNGKQYVQFHTTSGVGKISPDAYMKAIRTYRPDALIALTDTPTEMNPSTSRIRRSVKRSLEHLDRCIALNEDKAPIFAVIQGGHVAESRKHSAMNTADRDVNGYVVATPDTTHLPMDNRVSLLSTTLEHLPVDKPRIAYGFSRPEEMLKAIQHGIDLLDGSYVYHVTSKGQALELSFDAASPIYRTYDLWSTENREVLEPLIKGCPCYTCSHHTRAYTHHLLQVKEMLAEVLLMAHNMYQYNRFLEQIRLAITEGSFTKTAATFPSFPKELERAE
ncbi:MAG: tRNA-guanine(15) transglycosylase-like protein [Piptocephalis tieghemiana]|nr:MAG: tRNA-guanine(15) transglycosylase-like protein [Piptocephalis tieghemiana]